MAGFSGGNPLKHMVVINMSQMVSLFKPSQAITGILHCQHSATLAVLFFSISNPVN
jgi:hypothetical protein